MYIAFLRLTTKEEENTNTIYAESVIYDTRTNYSVALEEDIAFRKSNAFTHLVSKIKFTLKRWEEQSMTSSSLYQNRFVYIYIYTRITESYEWNSFYKLPSPLQIRISHIIVHHFQNPTSIFDRKMHFTPALRIILVDLPALELV